jgi:hypothetical protein
MLYRDYMQKFRPLLAPDGPAGGGNDGAAAASAAAQPGASPPAGPSAADSAAAASAAVSETASAEVGAAAAEKPALSLLEAASGKPKSEPAKPDAAAAPAADAGKPDPAEKSAKDAPAPADAAKTDADKPASDAAAKPKTEAELKAEAEAAKATDPAKKEATAEAQPPAPVKYEAFKVPDGLKLDDERVAKFAEIAGPAQVSQDVAQSFINLHLEEIQRVANEAQKAAREFQVKSWNTYVDTITNDLRKDPELGGNRLETSLSMAKAVVEEYLPANEAAEYLALLTHNGMGNHRLQVKLLQKIGKVLNIFEDGIVPANPQAPKPQRGPGNRGWYNDAPGLPSS